MRIFYLVGFYVTLVFAHDSVKAHNCLAVKCTLNKKFVGYAAYCPDGDYHGGHAQERCAAQVPECYKKDDGYGQCDQAFYGNWPVKKPKNKKK